MYTDYNDDNEKNYYADDDNGNRGFDNEKLKRIIFFVLVFVILILLILVIAKGCSKNNSAEPVKNEDLAYTLEPRIMTSRTNISLGVGDSFQIEGEVANRKNASVIWYQDDPNIVDIDENGNITALNEGETTVVAFYKEDGESYTSECNVIVTSKEVKIKSISLGSEEMTMKLDDTFLLQVTPEPTDAKLDDLIFESENADIVFVDENGYMTANSVGITAVTVKTKDETVSSSIIVKVTETGETEVYPTKIELIKLATGLTPDSLTEIEYEIEPKNTTNSKVTWTSSNPSVATVEFGVVTGVAPGTCTIIATTENGLSSKLDIVVESNDIPVESITIDGDTSITLPLGSTKQLSYTILPENATNKNVTYTVENSDVLFLDYSGKIAGIGVGSSIVTITTENGSKTAIVDVTVTDSSKSGDDPTNPDNGSEEPGETTNSGSSDDSSSDSGDSSSGGNSSGSSDSSSGGSSSVSSDSKNSDSCSVNSFAIKSNQSGAVTSNNRFENAKAFTGANPGLKVVTYDSCINKSKSYYDLWYAKDKASLNTSKSPIIKNKKLPNLNGTLSLNKGDGYYYIKVYITTNDGKSYYKYYYAIVENGGKSSSDSSTGSSSSMSAPGFISSSADNSVVLNGRSAVRVTIKFKDTSGKLTVSSCNAKTKATKATCSNYSTNYITTTRSGSIYTSKYTVYTDKLTSGQKLFLCFFASNAYNKSVSRCIAAYTKL